MRKFAVIITIVVFVLAASAGAQNVKVYKNDGASVRAL